MRLQLSTSSFISFHRRVSTLVCPIQKWQLSINEALQQRDSFKGGHYDDTVNWVQFWFTFSSNFSSSSSVASKASSFVQKSIFWILTKNFRASTVIIVTVMISNIKSVWLLKRSLSHLSNPDFVSVSNVSFPLLLPSNGNLDQSLASGFAGRIDCSGRTHRLEEAF